MQKFLIGDLHFFDPNIIMFSRNFFQSVEEMNHRLIFNWNKVVSNDDMVFVLGDFFDLNNCDEKQISETLSSLNGQITLIVGNHDKEGVEIFKKYGVTVIEYPIVIDEFFILSHEPMFVDRACPYANIFAHVHNNPMYRTLSSRSYCVSAERIAYAPILLSEIEKLIKEYSKVK